MVVRLVLAGCFLAACSTNVAPLTPEPLPSVAAEVVDEATEVRDAFLALMADPDVTYRVDSEVAMGTSGQGEPAILIQGRHDVAGENYAGSASSTAVALEHPVGHAYVVALPDGTHAWQSETDTWRSVDHPDVGYRPTPVGEIGAEDLLFRGRTADELFEFDVQTWVFGDPIGTWSALGGFGDQQVPSTSTESHRTRLLLDEHGVPVELRSSWTFSSEDDADVAGGSALHRFSAFGLYVSIPEDFETAQFMGTSHDITVGVDDTNTVIREPWFDVGPGPDKPSAELDVTVDFQDDEPVMLGIEGAIFFVGSHEAASRLVLDGIVPFEGGMLNAPPGQQTLEAYYRTCGGHCAALDPPSSFCTIQADLDAGARYELSVIITSGNPVEADCMLAPGQ